MVVLVIVAGVTALVNKLLSVTIGFIELSASHEYDAFRVFVLLLDGEVQQCALSRRCRDFVKTNTGR